LSIIGIVIDIVSMAAMFAAGALAGRLWEQGLQEPIDNKLMPRELPMPVLHKPERLVTKINSPFVPKTRARNELPKTVARNVPKVKRPPSIDWGS
jgi:hypothetical protein